MPFVKRNYVAGETVITAESLNEIQDELIRVGSERAVEVDATLTQASKAADAKAVGDRFASLAPSASPSLGNVLVFGDSLSSGYNSSNRTDDLPKWSDYLTNAREVRNHAVAGSTFGTGYAVDAPVKTSSLEDMIRIHGADIAWADLIVIAYGGNDAKACSQGTTTYDNAYQKAFSCIDALRTANPNARIVYAYLGEGSINQSDIAGSYRDIAFINAMFNLMSYYGVEICYMTNGSGFGDSDYQSDHRHPNSTGIAKIGKNMDKLLLTHLSFSPRKNIDLWVGDTSSYNPHKYRYGFVSLLQSIGCEVSVYMFLASGVLGKGHLNFNNSALSIIQWQAASHSGGGKTQRISVDIRANSNGSYAMLDTV